MLTQALSVGKRSSALTSSYARDAPTQSWEVRGHLLYRWDHQWIPRTRKWDIRSIQGQSRFPFTLTPSHGVYYHTDTDIRLIFTDLSCSRQQSTFSSERLISKSQIELFWVFTPDGSQRQSTSSHSPLSILLLFCVVILQRNFTGRKVIN